VEKSPALGSIFLRKDGKLEPLTEKTYDAEHELQALLAEHADPLLGGDQIGSTPRRWLLLAREMGLPGEDGGGARWSVDHLFIDQEGIPTIVEVKRSTNTEIRREVVGQMLDYAANGIAYWSIDALRAQFEARWREQDGEPDKVLRDTLGDDIEPERFWDQVKTNLQAGKVRLVFVADIIPPELRRIVDFLNRQMNAAQVLAVEIRQYVGGQYQALVPRVVSQPPPPPPSSEQWTEERFFAAIRSEAVVARRILVWAREQGIGIRWGKGSTNGAFTLTLDVGDGRQREAYPLLSIWTSGNFHIDFTALRNKHAFKGEETRLDYLGRMKNIPRMQLHPDNPNGYPSGSLAPLTDDESLRQFFEVIRWARDECRESASIPQQTDLTGPSIGLGQAR
jgi:hypothetical protein